MEEDLTRKAQLLLGGTLRLPEGYAPPCRIAHSDSDKTCDGAAVLSFGRYRVKKNISYSEGEFELRTGSDGITSIYRGDELIIRGVGFQSIVRRCPDQAFFNIDHRDEYYEGYCNPMFFSNIRDEGLTVDDVLESLREDNSKIKIKAVSFTSSQPLDVEETLDRLCEIIAAVRAEFPKVAIGVEPYVTTPEHILRVRDAGANELKLNVECARRDIHELLFPDRDYDAIFDLLKEANSSFRKGKLASNVTYGMGETDQDVDMLLEKLCRMNVIPNLRMVRVDGYNIERLTAAGIVIEPPSALRALFLGGLQKSAMKRHGLEPSRFHTMCLGCQCCNLVPFKDF